MFQGNYKSIVEGVSSTSSVRPSSPSSSSSSSSSAVKSPAKKDEPIMVRTSKPAKAESQMVKVQDLSDLSPAGNRHDPVFLVSPPPPSFRLASRVTFCISILSCPYPLPDCCYFYCYCCLPILSSCGDLMLFLSQKTKIIGRV